MSTKSIPSLGAQIRTAREAKGLTQRQLGDAVGASHVTVNRWESEHTTREEGAREPSVAMLRKMAKALDTTFTIGP
jgi:transcriptional regulator with XRE-family HTH domain